MRIPKLTDLIHSPRFDLDRNRGGERRRARARVAGGRRVAVDTVVQRSSASLNPQGNHRKTTARQKAKEERVSNPHPPLSERCAGSLSECLGHAPSPGIDWWNGTTGASLARLCQGYLRFFASAIGRKGTASRTAAS